MPYSLTSFYPPVLGPILRDAVFIEKPEDRIKRWKDLCSVSKGFLAVLQSPFTLRPEFTQALENYWSRFALVKLTPTFGRKRTWSDIKQGNFSPNRGAQKALAAYVKRLESFPHRAFITEFTFRGRLLTHQTRVRILLALPRLNSLCFDEYLDPEEPVNNKELTAYLSRHPNLTNLSLSHCEKVTEIACHKLPKLCALSVQSCTKIHYLFCNLKEQAQAMRSLSIYNTPVEDEPAALEFLKLTQNLLFLTFPPSIQIDEKSLIRFLENNRGLLGLNIEGQKKLTDRTLQALRINCPSLRVLKLGRSFQISDFGIWQLVQGCKSLNILQLSTLPQITGRSFQHLLDAKIPLTTLRVFSCSGIARSAIDKMCIHLPNLDIIVN
jgi:hypothetical protein